MINVLKKFKYKRLKFGDIDVSIDSYVEDFMPENDEILPFLESIFGRPMINGVPFYIVIKYYKGFKIVELLILQSDGLKIGDFKNKQFMVAGDMLYIGLTELQNRGWIEIEAYRQDKRAEKRLFIKLD